MLPEIVEMPYIPSQDAGQFPKEKNNHDSLSLPPPPKRISNMAVGRNYAHVQFCIFFSICTEHAAFELTSDHPQSEFYPSALNTRSMFVRIIARSPVTPQGYFLGSAKYHIKIAVGLNTF
jgi:hypothetical protein